MSFRLIPKSVTLNDLERRTVMALILIIFIHHKVEKEKYKYIQHT